VFFYIDGLIQGAIGPGQSHGDGEEEGWERTGQHIDNIEEDKQEKTTNDGGKLPTPDLWEFFGIESPHENGGIHDGKIQMIGLLRPIQYGLLKFGTPYHKLAHSNLEFEIHY
jgi:hypothetical protein